MTVNATVRLQQKFQDIFVACFWGQHEGSVTIIIVQIHVCSCTDQRFDDDCPSSKGSKVQGSALEPAWLPVDITVTRQQEANHSYKEKAGQIRISVIQR